jgi:putative SOS response-associated peptidase YedK
MPHLESAADRRREQHRHPLGLPLIPRRDKAAGVLEDPRLGRVLCGRFLFGGGGALRLHLASIEAHRRVVGRRVGTLVKQRYMLSVMCGRYTYKLTWEEIVRLYRLTIGQPAQNTRARYNVCPTTAIDIIVDNAGERRLEQMRWGLVPSWWSKPLKDLKLATFNARAENVAEKPFFREAFKRQRCLIPVSGYYEWQDTPSGKQPCYFTARDGSPASTIAGLWDEWQDKVSGETLKSCTMIVTSPNKFVAEVHDRMPVLLAQKDFEPWLSGSAGLELLKPADDDLLQNWPVSKRVNSSRAPDEDATLIDRISG